jgi:hypothetical protein
MLQLIRFKPVSWVSPTIVVGMVPALKGFELTSRNRRELRPRRVVGRGPIKEFLLTLSKVRVDNPVNALGSVPLSWLPEMSRDLQVGGTKTEDPGLCEGVGWHWSAKHSTYTRPPHPKQPKRWGHGGTNTEKA